MSEERYVAAIEISSSKIIGTVGIPREQGKLDVIAVEQEKCASYVRMGFIQNIDETAYRINRVIERLQNKSTVTPRKITKVFVGIGGRSMRNIAVETLVNIHDDTTVDQTVVDNLSEQAHHHPLDSSLEQIDCVPRFYMVDKRETPSPIGWVGKSIEATFDLIVARPELKKNILRTFSKVPGVTPEGFIVTAMATGQLILSADDKHLGCMLVDMGAETTTVTIYTNNALRYYATLPMGSRNITRDITTLKVSEERAEDIKLTSGNALPPNSPSELDFHGVKQSEISDLVVARSEEIVANIIAQIQYAGLTNDDLPAGIVIIGGGAKLNGMVELMKKQSYLKVRRGELPGYITITDTKVPTSEAIEVVSVLYAAATNTDVNCLEKQVSPSLPEVDDDEYEDDDDDEPKERNRDKKKKPVKEKEHKNKTWQNFKDKISRMFVTDEDEEDSEL